MSFPRYLASFVLLPGIVCAGATDGELLFDTQTLEARGYSADLGRYFGKAARFLPGTQDVWIRLNGSRSQRVQARFGSDGELCFDAALLKRLGLRPQADPSGCADAATLWPTMRQHYHPGAFRVELTLPETAFDPASRQSPFLHGGTALLLNYELFAQRADTPQSGHDYLQATLEPGLNMANWALRSRGVLTRMGTSDRFGLQETYAQRPISLWKARLQLGQINAFGTQFGGLPLYGLQIGSDSAQDRAGALLIPIQGNARTHATLEVSQRGRVIYRSLLPPGPFTVAGIPGLTAGADIDVAVIEENGQRQPFSLPSQIGAGPQAASAWSLGLGRYRNPAFLGGRSPAAELLMAEYAHRVGKALHFTHAALLSRDYRSQASLASLSLASGAWASAGMRHSNTRGIGQGVEFSAQGHSNLSPHLAGSLSWLSRGPGYIDADRAFAPFDMRGTAPRIRQSLSMAAAWAHPRWGALSYVAARSSYHDSDGRSGLTHTLSINRSFDRIGANLSWQKSPISGSTVLLNLSIPLGRGSLRSNVQRTPRGTLEASTSYSAPFGRHSRYALEQSGNSENQRSSASVSTETAYARLNAGASWTTRHTRAAHVSVTGGLAYADQLLGTSASRIDDTFALVQVPGQAGLRMQAPNGSAITNSAGIAVIARVEPYTKAPLRLDTRSLPRNIRLDTTQLELGLARNSVSVHRIGATKVRRLLLEIRDTRDQWIPVGVAVYDENGKLLGTVVGEGNFMLVNEDIGKRIRIGGSQPCTVSYQVPQLFDADIAYQSAPAICS